MKQPILRSNDIAIVKENDLNYMVLAKDRIYEGEQLYKVQSFNSQTKGYGHTDYSLSFDNAIQRLNKRGFQQDYREKYRSMCATYTLNKKYHKESLEHLLGLHNEEMLSEEDFEEKIEELS